MVENAQLSLESGRSLAERLELGPCPEVAAQPPGEFSVGLFSSRCCKPAPRAVA